MNRMFFYCVANVVKRDLVSPGSLLYNSNYAMDADVHSMRLRRPMSFASLTHIDITSVAQVEARQWRTITPMTHAEILRREHELYL